MMIAMHEPSFFTIPPGCAFATDLARGLLARYSSEELARAEIYLPTRRAVRALSAAFLQESKGRALLLPKLRAIGDIEEDATIGVQFDGVDDGALPPAIAQMRRLCLIALQVQSFPISGHKPSEAQAFALARALVQLSDQIQNAEFDIAQMADLWPKELAAHWQDIAQFLSILWRFWPAILEAEGAMDPVARRIALMDKQVTYWQDNPPSHPIIMAGSTGTLPATQRVMKTIANLPQGLVVFPGMLPDISKEDWQAICADKVHPLHPLSLTLQALSLPHDSIAIWPQSAPRGAPRDALVAARNHFLQEVMRPASQTDKWRALGSASSAHLMEKQSYAGFTRLEAQDAHEEASIIALAMRRALEVPDKTAILVTADRQLARMVQSELRRFEIEIDDSAGEPLSQTGLGTYLMLLARLIGSQKLLDDVVALAAHPLAAGQTDRVHFRQMMSELNQLHLRGALAFDDLTGLMAHLSDAPKMQQFVQDHLLAPLMPLLETDGTCALGECAQLIGNVAENFAATHLDGAAEAALRLWSGPEGEAASNALRELDLYGGDFALSYDAFPDILHHIMAAIDVRRPFQTQSRLAILGAVESRMITADLVIISGLNEGVWPPKASQDLWMNQSMAEAMGLPHKQWRIALSAHDFMMAAAMPEVIITRSRRTNDAPTLPSRWLTRMDAVMKALAIDDLIAPKIPEDIAAILSYRSDVEATPIAPPAPKPPLAMRPTRFSATQFDRLIGDPYAIYARHILRLRALAPLNEAPNAALKGTLFHEALQRFVQHHQRGKIGQEHLGFLIEIGKSLFAPWESHYEVRHFWWPQFIAVAQWFIEHDNVLRAPHDISFAELQGEMVFQIGARHFTVTAKADRIVHHGDGAVTIIDYKTGGVPTKKSVEKGRSTQMLVEAGLIATGGYSDIPATDDIRSLSYWKLQGRTKDAGIKTDVTPKSFNASSLPQAMEALLARFEDEDMPYHAEPDARGGQAFSDYRHLARIKEWRVLEVDND